jgi:hypothetical protein
MTLRSIVRLRVASPLTTKPRSLLRHQPRYRPHDRRASFNSGQALPCCLDNFRRCRGIDSISDRSFGLVKAGWKQYSEERYEQAWQSFKDFLRPSSIPFHQASLKDVMDYLAHLFDRKLSWNTIGIHRSAISMTLAPINGVLVGEHPIVKRLMGGVFNKRPPRPEAPALWDPLKVLSVFQDWPVVLPLSSLMRKGAFLMAIVTAKRAHELASLLSDANHFRWEGDAIRFTPSHLTKTDRPGHLCSPFYVKPWKEDLSVCPVETVRLILQERDRLRLSHNAIFFSWMHPHDQLDAAAAVFNIVSFKLASRRLPVPPDQSQLPPRWPVACLLVMFCVSVTGATP